MIHRLIANLLIRNGVVVQTNKFNVTNYIGNAYTAVDFFNSWAVDEICILEISEDDSYVEKFCEIIEELSKRCFVPLTVGGKILNINHARKYFQIGADKVAINSGALKKNLIPSLAKEFGSQAVVLSADIYENKNLPSNYGIAIKNGKKKMNIDAIDWIVKNINDGVGEVLINSIDHDGNRKGYNLDFLKILKKNIKVPIIIMGGVGEWMHMLQGIENGAQSVAAANIFHFTEHSTKKAKEYLIESGVKMRPSYFYTLKSSRKVRDILNPID